MMPKAVAGSKQDKLRLMVLFATNATGSDKLQPLVIDQIFGKNGYGLLIQAFAFKIEKVTLADNAPSHSSPEVPNNTNEENSIDNVNDSNLLISDDRADEEQEPHGSAHGSAYESACRGACKGACRSGGAHRSARRSACERVHRRVRGRPRGGGRPRGRAQETHLQNTKAFQYYLALPSAPHNSSSPAYGCWYNPIIQHIKSNILLENNEIEEIISKLPDESQYAPEIAHAVATYLEVVDEPIATKEVLNDKEIIATVQAKENKEPIGKDKDEDGVPNLLVSAAKDF
ncbi:14454_t:CDS:2 [Gigaspora margarita]|uniref:14454_t:CDS:1 n=1 Tax=Gigaspora margarita TaxID=4874 RepID=A0ABN7ULH9_GIGMA|nr:14454_t:CDS:2 [Gigaspora margarita]